jgi:hypothetical protein
LVTITSLQEWSDIRAAIPPSILEGKVIWIGATDSRIEGQWEWVTGEPWSSYLNWRAGEPNNTGDEDFLELTQLSGSPWNDSSLETTRNYYLLEIEAPTPLPPLINAFTISRLAFGRIQGLRIPLSPPDQSPFRIEVSHDLKAWLPLISFPTNSGPFEFIDSAATNQPVRFYRAVKY